LLAAFVGEPGVEAERHLRVRVTCERGRLRERGARSEREPDEAMTEIVEADRLPAVRVEPGSVPGRMQSAERVPARLRPAPSRGEGERVGVDAAKVLACRERQRPRWGPSDPSVVGARLIRRAASTTCARRQAPSAGA
jgi:hypothetical protein